MPFDIDEEKLHSIMSRYGKIQDIKPIYNEFGQLKSCYVKYEFRQDAVDATQSLTQIGWRMEWVSNLPAPDQSAILPDSVFIGRIPSTVTKEMILDAVGKYGSVTALNLVIPPGSPQTPSFCFVSFHDPQSAQLCITDLNGILFIHPRNSMAWKCHQSPVYPRTTTFTAIDWLFAHNIASRSLRQPHNLIVCN